MRRITALTTLALLVTGAMPALGSDRKPPKITRAVMVDKDEDGSADRVVLDFTEKIKHRADADGIYPFRVVGYKIASIGWAADKQLTIKLVERTRTDPAAKPNVLYDRGRDEGVYDRAGNETRTETFKGTKPFVSVPAGSSLLIVNVDGPGTVSTLDGTFECATSCYEVLSDTPVLTLTAQPDDGATFEEWGGACTDSGTQSLCSLVLDSNKTVGATFQ